MTLPADSHVHSEWSWDAPNGDMERSCARAVELGLPAIAFTEHVDHTVWTVAPGALDGYDHLLALTSPDGHLTPPAFDAAGYLAAVERCRERFPDLRILSGLEVGEPHRHADAVAGVLAAGGFDRVLGSLHSLPAGEGFSEPPGLYASRPAAEVVRDYLAEIPEVVVGSDAFAVLAHVDYPVRYWPVETAGPFDPKAFEEEFRHALRVTAGSGRALEINTVVPLHATLLGWWREEGGQAVTFGSDAHEPSVVARRFREAADLAWAHGFRPGRDPYDFWGRTG
ncbi:PHP domain-containing protein [Nonomuraea spiralis]|uniref:PHP domain-containing protein n=1 Tax=Nonomuraea TaxID=83681 RepID=UPI000F7B97DF|nr:PHP domain-containing protein [Nonomuraea sp. WAC 01424]RSN04956.1 histidinol-phosphatase [Nonomuraea sp. WAC 01424]